MKRTIRDIYIWSRIAQFYRLSAVLYNHISHTNTLTRVVYLWRCVCVCSGEQSEAIMLIYLYAWQHIERNVSGGRNTKKKIENYSLVHIQLYHHHHHRPHHHHQDATHTQHIQQSGAHFHQPKTIKQPNKQMTARQLVTEVWRYCCCCCRCAWIIKLCGGLTAYASIHTNTHTPGIPGTRIQRLKRTHVCPHERKRKPTTNYIIEVGKNNNNNSNVWIASAAHCTKIVRFEWTQSALKCARPVRLHCRRSARDNSDQVMCEKSSFVCARAFLCVYSTDATIRTEFMLVIFF